MSAVLCNGAMVSRSIHSMGKVLFSDEAPAMLAMDDKPETQGVDVTASCDQQRFFRISRKLLKNSFRDDVALKHDFTGYMPTES